MNYSTFAGSNDELRAWLNQRKGRSLNALRLEVLEWALAEEEKIGAPAAGDEEKYLAPLRRRIEEKRRDVNASTER